MSFFEITDRYVLEQALHDQVLTDPLTGLANRFAARRCCSMVKRMVADEPRPRGEQEVRKAVLVAAAALFADKGPAATSVREIAGAAGVNHGLIHRHFGTKRQLVRAVHDHLAEGLAATGPFHEASLESALQAFHSLEAHRSYWIVLTRATLDGELDDVLASDLAGAHRMVETLRAALPDSPTIDAADLVAMAFSFSLGWLLLRDFIQVATGAGDDVPERWFAAMAALLTSEGASRART